MAKKRLAAGPVAQTPLGNASSAGNQATPEGDSRAALIDRVQKSSAQLSESVILLVQMVEAAKVTESVSPSCRLVTRRSDVC